MARKGEKSKARAKSPDKSPRRVGRPSRRRKKSESESGDEKKNVEPAEVDQGESSESGRMRRSGRRQAEPSTSEPKPQTNEWKEDESFWSKEDEEKAKTEPGSEEGGTVWKVQTSNGSSGGEIQKLRICRQRPGGAGSDSAESSMSPAKDSSSSPLHKRALKKDAQKSPLVESNVAEIELPPVAGTSEPQDTSEISLPPSQASDEAVPENNSIAQKVVEYIYETQPSGAASERVSLPQVNESDSAPNKGTDSSSSQPVELPVDESKPEITETNTEPVVEQKAEEITPVAKDSENTSKNQPEESNVEDPKVPVSEDTTEVKEAEESKELEKAIESVADIPPPDEPHPHSESVKPAEPVTDEMKTSEATEPAEAAKQESSMSPAKASATGEGRRKSDSSIKSSGSRRSSVSGSAANSEYNEPLLEINANKSPMQEGKEEGEIVDDEKSDVEPKRRVITIKTKSEDGTPGKITINRQSTGESSSSVTASKSGSTSSTAATTAKKHPLITGPEPDESSSSRRRKLTSLTTATTTTRTITTGGSSRPVRSIPGEALKAVLHPDTEKKDKEKRPKMIKVKEDKSESGGGELPTTESKVNKVEDVRELIKHNRSHDKKVTEKESRHSAKSPVKTITVESKAPARKVSIGSAPLSEDVKPSKPSRSKSPGENKATPILFITNLVRPFTAGQLKELLARTGTIARNGFFIDKIKSKCFVKYADVEMATETRHALNGVRWPVSNPKNLKVAFATEKELKVIQDSAEGEVVDDITSPRSGGSGWLSSEQAAVKDKEKKKTSGPSTREWDRGKPTKAGTDGAVIFIDDYGKEEKLRNTASYDTERNDRIRDHHDRDKALKEEHSRNHSDRDKDRERDRERRKRRSTPIDIENSSPPPARKFKKKDCEAPAKLLDDLFKKTKTSPCLYWLPLSAEQIAVKEETRRKHMAEHERRMAELKKSTQQRRDKERDRDRDRRRK